MRITAPLALVAPALLLTGCSGSSGDSSVGPTATALLPDMVTGTDPVIALAGEAYSALTDAQGDPAAALESIARHPDFTTRASAASIEVRDGSTAMGCGMIGSSLIGD